jgi:hypothetical protein
LLIADFLSVCALFDPSQHLEGSPERETSALVFLDSIIHHLSLTCIDVNEPGVSRFPPSSVPIVSEGQQGGHLKDVRTSHHRKCLCILSTTAVPQDHFSHWSYLLPSRSLADIKKEETRRFCWSTLNLLVEMCFVPEKASRLLFKPSEQCALPIPPSFFCVCADGNIQFSMFFPGEAMDRVSPLYRSSPSSPSRESDWALYCRSMLLWIFCIRLRSDTCSDEDKA